MDLGLKGKVAIVAASSKGPGQAVAIGLGREWALVTVKGRNAAMVAATAAAIQAETEADVLQVLGDLTEPGAAEHLVEETMMVRGGVDVVVCNSGGPPSGNLPRFRTTSPGFKRLSLI
jgi:3-oxoacyl-[acyl-carrier protein] reductase